MQKTAQTRHQIGVVRHLADLEVKLIVMVHPAFDIALFDGGPEIGLDLLQPFDFGWGRIRRSQLRRGVSDIELVSRAAPRPESVSSFW